MALNCRSLPQFFPEQSKDLCRQDQFMESMGSRPALRQSTELVARSENFLTNMILPFNLKRKRFSLLVCGSMLFLSTGNPMYMLYFKFENGFLFLPCFPIRKSPSSAQSSEFGHLCRRILVGSRSERCRKSTFYRLIWDYNSLQAVSKFQPAVSDTYPDECRLRCVLRSQPKKCSIAGEHARHPAKERLD